MLDAILEVAPVGFGLVAFACVCVLAQRGICWLSEKRNPPMAKLNKR